MSETDARVFRVPRAGKVEFERELAGLKLPAFMLVETGDKLEYRIPTHSVLDRRALKALLMRLGPNMPGLGLSKM
jgi:hypothetical protein